MISQKQIRNEEKNPFFHVFQTSEGSYLFDVNTDRILKISKDVYKYLYSIESGITTQVEPSVHKYVENLKNEGYLSSNRVKQTEHPATELLPYYINNKINFITLQITQSCNLRCSYCVYSGKYKNRNHSQKTMSRETAQKAIDYYINHSKDTKSLSIGFYGGEPLLCMEMIKYCVEYADKNAEGREIRYSITTNGTLFNDKSIQYLIDHDFHLIISLDGPAAIHNKNRRYAKNNEGSYHTVIQNIRHIKDNFPLFYKDNIMFNTVLDPMNDFGCINDYIMNSIEFEDSYFFSSLIDDRYLEQSIPYNSDFFTDNEYEIFKLYLKKLNWFSDCKTSKLVDNYFSQISRSRGGKQTTFIKELPQKYHRGGPCLPVMRMFVSADGYFYPCERVSESSQMTKIGHVNNGVDFNLAERILNIERVTAQMCHNCWAYRYCQICVGSADNLNEISSELIQKRCPQVRRQVEGLFKDYCVIKGLGYDFDFDETGGLINF